MLFFVCLFVVVVVVFLVRDSSEARCLPLSEGEGSEMLT